MRRGTFVRWGVPIAVAAVIGGAIGAGPVIAAVSGNPQLPERTAQQLLADAVAASHKAGGPPPMSGTVQQTASLGLPALPESGGSSPLNLLSGSHEVKVWYGAQNKLRVAFPTQMSESNLIVNGDQTWYWDSSTKTATRLKFDAGTQKPEDLAPRPTDLTPPQVAERMLANADQHTAIRVINNAEVAGRAAYQLVLAPKEEGSLVQEVRIALDGETYVPLQVQVYAKGSAEPAFQVGFTQVTFSAPAEENFRFTPPAGAKVEDKTISGKDLGKEHAEAEKARGAVKSVGEGWTTVAVLPVSAADLAAKPQQDQGGLDKGGIGKGGEDKWDGKAPDFGSMADTVLKSATPVSGSWGSGKLITTKLVTALLTDDGRLLVGAVTPAEIEKAAGIK